MIKNEFLEMINLFGFKKSGERSYYLITDRLEELVIIMGQTDHFQLNIEKRSFGNFNLTTFGHVNDFQMEIFFSFLISSFDVSPTCIRNYMRDWKIKNILKYQYYE